ncbi:MAG: hypothetical protein JST85_28610 [Acidobacteria bacterium]|nr:hypothetical protein [Acidobacteriota bacterium]
MTINENRSVEQNDSKAGAPRLTLSLAMFVLICFFLPWLQISCLGARDSQTGLALTRGGDTLLWLVPIAMVTILGLGLIRFVRKTMPGFFSAVAMIGGGLSSFLMYKEQAGAVESNGLIGLRWTIWFWLGFVASLGIVASAIRFYANRVRPP